MDKYDDVVIGDLAAQVARLEAALADMTALRDEADDAAGMFQVYKLVAEGLQEKAEQKCDKAQAANAAKDVALRAVIQKCPLCRGKGTLPHGVSVSGRNFPCPRCQDMRAALSAGGEGWQNPVKRWDALRGE